MRCDFRVDGLEFAKADHCRTPPICWVIVEGVRDEAQRTPHHNLPAGLLRFAAIEFSIPTRSERIDYGHE
jgi:hypothetical protein